ncbi:MAG: transketolase family protein [Anaerolineae bacterium]|nr:transketolase family protein [Anaerolineae bacterium]
MESLSLCKPNLEEFAQTLLALASQNKDILVVTGDSRGSGKLVPFGKTLPAQIVEIGIAEQNLVGISAGLASAGKKVFTVAPACFLTSRSLEQIKNDVAYSDNPVKLIGISAGVSYGALGSTHHSIHDYAVLRAIHNIDIVSPADNFETRKVIEAAVDHPRPIYIRMGKKPMYDLHTPDTRFEVGKAIVLSEGSDVTFLATGEPLSRAVMAAHLLEQEGLSVGVISMHSLCPFDEAAILRAAQHTKVMVSVEEHSVHGGLGSLIASLLMQNGFCPRLKIIGIPDEYTVTGSQKEIFCHYGIIPEGLAETARQTLNAKEN